MLMLLLDEVSFELYWPWLGGLSQDLRACYTILLPDNHSRVNVHRLFACFYTIKVVQVVINLSKNSFNNFLLIHKDSLQGHEALTLPL